ncbi:Transporter mfs1 [Schizosaccharomyces pombe]
MWFLRETIFGELVEYFSGGTRQVDVEKLGVCTDNSNVELSSCPDSSFDDEKTNQVNSEGLIIVTWDGEDDPENPKNWPLWAKLVVTFDVCFLTFAVYMGSAIFTPGIQEIRETMHVGTVPVILGLTLFVEGYAVGPLIFSPLSEVPQIGRQKIYVLSLIVFICLQIPTALGSSLGVLLPMRFLAGVFGSPALSTGGASLADIWQPWLYPYFMCFWSLGAVGGPVLGPLLGAAMVVAKSWRWQFWLLMMISALVLVIITFFMPETSEWHLLYKRAKRLRELTGNPNYKTEAEIASSQLSKGQFAKQILVRPIILCVSEPIVLSLTIYIGLVYSILYLWFEAFPILFTTVYHFTTIENGLVYMGILVGSVLTVAFYFIYLRKVMIPKFVENKGKFPAEEILIISFPAAFFIPISLFWFGWTGRESVHWIVPIVGTLFYASGSFLLFQSMFQYLAAAYPKYVASVFAGNALFRSSMAAASPPYARAMFNNTGPSYAPVGWGSTILGVISCIMIPIPFLIYKWGLKLRSRSKYAT